MKMTMDTTDLYAPAVARLCVARRDPANSFVLHAQLELMARIGLLEYVSSDVLAAALSRIDTLADEYTATGPAAPDPVVLSFASVADAVTALAAALDHGDLDRVDAAVVWLGERVSGPEVGMLLGETVVDSLAAAGHAPIGLHLLHRIAGGALPVALLRGPLRELARNPTWKLTWFRSVTTGGGDDLTAALTALPHLGRPGSDFIYPLMSQAEGIASGLLGGVLEVDPVLAARTLSRAAVWSMLNDDPSQAPYGWSHCLTMSQAVMSLAGRGVEARTAVAVAATFVVGFRAANGLQPLGPLDDAAAAADGLRETRSVEELANFAALHDDAHLVKYTLACIHAADDDPDWGPVYLHAAAFLADWWRARVDG
jgi:hypothetical protein